MKSGTTSIHGILKRHPEIIEGSRKELNFFKNDCASEDKRSKYLEQFDIVKGQHRYTLESSPDYTKHKNFDEKRDYDIPRRISQICKNVKLIYTMRDPITRCESHIAHNIEHGRVARDSFNLKHPIRTSLYASQLDIYKKYFRPDQIFLMSIDEFRKNPDPTLRSIERFCGLDKNSLRGLKPRKVRKVEGEILTDEQKREIATASYEDICRLIEEYNFSLAKEWLASLEKWRNK